MTTVKVGFKKQGKWSYRGFLIDCESDLLKFSDWLYIQIYQGYFCDRLIDKISLDFGDSRFDESGQLKLEVI